MIRLHGVSHRHAEHAVLSGLDLELGEQRIGIVGCNGSGKTSLLRLLNGLLLPDQGRVSVNGLDTRRQTAAVRREVGFVFQNPDFQIVMPTVVEDLAFGLASLDLSDAERDTRVQTMLQVLDLETCCHQQAHTLSGGQKRLLALGGVLVMRPSVVVLDEPTALLDMVNAERIRALLAGLDQQLVMVSHGLQDFDGFDRVIVLQQGQVVADAEPAEAIAFYRALVRGQLQAVPNP